MKTSDIEVRDMLSVLSVVGVENRIGEVPGVESVTVNYAAGLATVRYDETRLNVTDIKSAVRQGEYEPAMGGANSSAGHHEDHAAADKSPERPTPVTSPASVGQSGKLEPVAPAKPAPAPSAAKPSPVAGDASASDKPAPSAADDAAEKKDVDKSGMSKGKP